MIGEDFLNKLGKKATSSVKESGSWFHEQSENTNTTLGEDVCSGFNSRRLAVSTYKDSLYRQATHEING